VLVDSNTVETLWGITINYHILLSSRYVRLFYKHLHVIYLAGVSSAIEAQNWTAITVPTSNKHQSNCMLFGI
jgi:hypothetical protein